MASSGWRGCRPSAPQILEEGSLDDQTGSEAQTQDRAREDQGTPCCPPQQQFLHLPEEAQKAVLAMATQHSKELGPAYQRTAALRHTQEVMRGTELGTALARQHARKQEAARVGELNVLPLASTAQGTLHLARGRS